MYCWHCKKKIEKKKIGFREYCKNCEFDLHVCKNCKYFHPGKPRDCQVPLVEFVKDKEKYNFCEDFKPKQTLEEEKNKSLEDIEEKLFKEKEKKPFKKSFDSLFEDL